MDRTWKTNSEWGNPETDKEIGYTLTFKWILAIKYLLTKLQSVDPEKLGREERAYIDLCGRGK